MAAIDELAHDAKDDWHRPDWTRELKERLRKIGAKRGLRVYSSDGKDGELGEWLLDMTWLDADENYLYRVVLALESEWDATGAIDDFQKLLVCRADHRVMVLVAPNRGSSSTAIAKLVAQIENFRDTCHGDRFLFACWYDPDKRFAFELHVAGVGGGSVGALARGQNLGPE